MYTSVACATSWKATTRRHCCTPYAARGTACMTEHTSIKLRRTTAFRLSMTYAVVFCLLTIVALVVVYQHLLGAVNNQIDAGLRAEAVSLAADWLTHNPDRSQDRRAGKKGV